MNENTKKRIFTGLAIGLFSASAYLPNFLFEKETRKDMMPKSQITLQTDSNMYENSTLNKQNINRNRENSKEYILSDKDLQMLNETFQINKTSKEINLLHHPTTKTDRLTNSTSINDSILNNWIQSKTHDFDTERIKLLLNNEKAKEIYQKQFEPLQGPYKY